MRSRLLIAATLLLLLPGCTLDLSTLSLPDGVSWEAVAVAVIGFLLYRSDSNKHLGGILQALKPILRLLGVIKTDGDSPKPEDDLRQIIDLIADLLKRGNLSKSDRQALSSVMMSVCDQCDVKEPHTHEAKL